MTIIHDVRDTWRSLARSPYFTIPVVLSLAFAIGTNVAAFSVINALVLRPLPVQDPDRLFHVTYVGEAGASEGGNYTWFEQVRDGARSISAAFLHHRERGMKVVVEGQIEALTGTYVSGGYFPALGITPQLGRLIAATDETGATPNRVAVISDTYWGARFGRDPGAIGRTIRVDGVPHDVIGVTRPEFDGVEVGRRFDVTVPIDGAEYRQGWASMAVLIRLPANGSPDAASEELTTLLGDFASALPEGARGRFQRVELEPIGTGLAPQGGVREQFATPLAAVSVILAVMLLLACANWAALLLARVAARRREMAIRLALGSSRVRLARQLFVESVSLALAGGALGLLAASWGVQYLPGTALPAAMRIEPDLTVLLFAVGLALATGVLFAVAPASFTARIHADDLRVAGRSADGRTGRLGRGLVIAQVALSLTMVVAAGLFATTLRNLRGQEMGFSGDGVVTFSLDAEGTGLEGERLMARHRVILDRLRALPGVQAATLATVSPLSGNTDGKRITIPGFVPQSPEDSNAQVDTIGPDYFATFGIPILRGRGIAEADVDGAPQVALVSESAARYYFPGADPIGRQMTISGSTTLTPEIVGVVPDVMYDDLRRGARRMFYVPFFQRYADGEYVFAVRTDGNPDALIAQIPIAMNAVAPDMPVLELSTLGTQIDERTFNERLLTAMSAFFGALALIVAGIGIYGIVGYTVARRTPELGLRKALGAPGRHVMWLVVRSSVGVLLTGMAIGLAMAFAARNLLTDILFGVRPDDPWIHGVAIGFLLLAGIVSAIPPVARALRLEPIAALRHE